MEGARNPVIGYSYKDGLGVNGPVKAAVIKKTGNGTFIVKVTAKGALGPGPQPHVRIAPPAPGTDGGMRFTINGGNTYCVAFGGAAGGAVTNAPSGLFNKVFKIVSNLLSPTTETGCPTAIIRPGNGTIVDAEAGLQWEKKDGADGTPGLGTPNAGNLHDVDNQYLWAWCCGLCSGTNTYQPNAAAEAARKAQTPAVQWTTGGCNVCPVGACAVVGAITTVWDWLAAVNGASFAGHTDWRLATVNQEGDSAELETIMDCTFGSPCINPLFGPTAASFYWSATTQGTASGNAWTTKVSDGTLLLVNKTNPEFVRAVR